MGLFSLKTGKAVDGPEVSVISDLDAMVADRVAFRLHGKVHYIRPISVKEFFAYTNALVAIQSLEKAETIEANHVVELYHGLIKSVCESVTKKDVQDMTQPQVAALIQLVSDCITGKAHVGATEKKN
jgi:hypothetical protein